MPKKYPSAPLDRPQSAGTAVFKDRKGEFAVELYAAQAPNTVNNFVFLARDHFYDGVTFHPRHPRLHGPKRLPTGTSTGGPGYKFGDEFDPGLRHNGPGTSCRWPTPAPTPTAASSSSPSPPPAPRQPPHRVWQGDARYGRGLQHHRARPQPRHQPRRQDPQHRISEAWKSNTLEP